MIMGKDIYRSRLNAPLDENVLDFLSSFKDDLWLAEEDIVGTEVHNIMLFEQGILQKEEIKKILTSLEGIREKLTNGKLKLDESFEDIHPAIEKCVIDDIGIDIGGKIHTGRSRNDQVSLDIVWRVIQTSIPDLISLIEPLVPPDPDLEEGGQDEK